MASSITLSEIIDRLTALSAAVRPDDFIYDFLACFGTPQATLTRLKSGATNAAKQEGCTLLKAKVYFDPRPGNPAAAIESAKKDAKVTAQKPRFLIATDFKALAAYDTKRQEALEIPISDLHENYTFFLPLAGMEKAVFQAESEADVKAAEHMAKLYDLIRVDNPPETKEERHALNVFLTRLLFCYFAEDTGIFPEKSFVGAIADYTQEDGSDVAEFLRELFLTLNTPGTRDTSPAERKNSHPSGTGVPRSRGIKPHLAAFPYVNGGLFSDTDSRHSAVPTFTPRSRQKLIELGKKDWKEINPDIFGSMFQGVVDDDKRAELGMHYTSVPNILKVIRPLFLDELCEEFEKAKGSREKLNKLLKRIYNLRIFDPACGSGNFLIIAYKELRKLETVIFQELIRLGEGALFSASGIQVSQFYGIELDDFAHEVAILALWLAEHQMNVKFREDFGKEPPALPLRVGARVVCADATLIEWDTVCPIENGHEVFIVGNPPYVGARMQTDEQKAAVCRCYHDAPEHRDADFISCWFLKGATYIAASSARLAFVTTNSVCQGDHVAILWPRILDRGLEIYFAYSSFKWANSAQKNAGVTCAIIGLRLKSNAPKWIFTDGLKVLASNINPYLAKGSNTVIGRRDEPLSKMPEAVMGSMARDGGHLILDRAERDQLLANYPQSKPLIRNLIGAQEFIRSEKRWCLWIEDSQLSLAKSIPPIAQRMAKVYELRVASTAKTTNGYAAISHQFAQRAHKDGCSIILPRVSSERRQYIPYGLLNSDSIISDSAIAIYNAEPYLFSVISSQMHMAWTRAVAGRLKTDYRYSSTIVYNNFPFPEIPDAKRKLLDQAAEKVLLTRERWPEKTIAQLYDPDTMPAELLAAHRALDLAVEQCYRAKPFTSDEERLEYLFTLYEEMTAKEKADLFTAEAAPKKKGGKK